jgi:hypothetical protein
MKRQFTILFLSLTCIVPVLAEETTEAPEEFTVEPFIELTPEQLKLLDEHMVREKRGFVINPGSRVPTKRRPELSGKWIEQDGVLMCDGYLTRVESEDYCEAQVPEDWQPFEFDGRTYFMIPLTDKRG